MRPEIKIKRIYLAGAITAVIVICLTLLDIVIGSSLGGDLSSIPRSAVDRFVQFQENRLLGLYYLDFLNFTVSIIMIPVFFALFVAHNNENNPFALLALLIFAIGTTVFIANNTAAPMLDLCRKYIAATSADQKNLFAAAGEALIAKGAHGSYGAFPGFIMITISEALISIVMLLERVFSRATGYIGLSGTILLMIYLVLVTFMPAAKESAMIFAAPGGILSIIWMIMFTGKLFRLAR